MNGLFSIKDFVVATHDEVVKPTFNDDLFAPNRLSKKFFFKDTKKIIVLEVRDLRASLKLAIAETLLELDTPFDVDLVSLTKLFRGLEQWWFEDTLRELFLLNICPKPVCSLEVSTALRERTSEEQRRLYKNVPLLKGLSDEQIKIDLRPFGLYITAQ